jgi:hypothetical protein
MQIQVLRQILKHFGLWAGLQGRIRFLREPRDTGRALTHDDETKLLEAAGRSRSPALLPRLVLALDTGIRTNEMRELRHRDLSLECATGLSSGVGLKSHGPGRKAARAELSHLAAHLRRSHSMD